MMLIRDLWNVTTCCVLVDVWKHKLPMMQVFIMNPAGTWRKYNVASTSMQRHDVASTLRRRYIYVMCLPGMFGQRDMVIKAGTINRIIDSLINKFHKNDYPNKFANNWWFDFCACYFTVFTFSTPYHTLSKIWTSTIYYPMFCLKLAG